MGKYNPHPVEISPFIAGFASLHGDCLSLKRGDFLLSPQRHHTFHPPATPLPGEEHAITLSKSSE
jgi:hypothetical protein